MTAYFDESGKHRQAKVLSIFGLLMSVDTSKELQRRWLREAVKKPAIPLPFHMSDCVAGTKVFDPWKNDEEMRWAMQERMIRMLTGLDIQAYGASIIRADYDKVAARLRPNQALRDPWFLAFEGGIAAMMKGSAETGKKHDITFVFDRQDEFGPKAHGLYNEVLASDLPYKGRLGTLSFSPKDKVAALQAIDVIVNEVNRHVTDHIDSIDERWQSNLIRQLIDIKAVLFNEPALRILAKEMQRSRGID